jgi:DNA polymerase
MGLSSLPIELKSVAALAKRVIVSQDALPRTVPAPAQPLETPPARPAPARQAPITKATPAATSADWFGATTPAATFVMPTEPFTAPVLDAAEKRLRLKTLDETQVKGCPKCRLCETRTQTVFGEGDPDARILFIGEGPGENEDLQGRPFVGKAGQLLDKMIIAMGLSRDKVFITNIVKCRPPNNREPAPDETAACTPYLLQQIEIIRPDAIVTLGRPSTQFLLQTKLAMSKLRGQWQEWRGIKVMPTYHPAYVLRSYTRDVREAVWSDLKSVLVQLKLPVPPRGSS